MPSPAYVQNNYSEPGFEPTSPQTVTLTGTTAGNMLVVIAAQQGSPLIGSFNTPTDGTNTYNACAASSFNDGSGTTFALPLVRGGLRPHEEWPKDVTDEKKYPRHCGKCIAEAMVQPRCA
jgi:hypothetical protein